MPGKSNENLIQILVNSKLDNIVGALDHLSSLMKKSHSRRTLLAASTLAALALAGCDTKGKASSERPSEIIPYESLTVNDLQKAYNSGNPIRVRLTPPFTLEENQSYTGNVNIKINGDNEMILFKGSPIIVDGQKKDLGTILFWTYATVLGSDAPQPEPFPSNLNILSDSQVLNGENRVDVEFLVGVDQDTKQFVSVINKVATVNS